MSIALLVCAAIAASVPIAATVVVSMASVREDRDRSLARPARSAVHAMARRIVAFHADGCWPQPGSHREALPFHLGKGPFPPLEAAEPSQAADGDLVLAHPL